MLAEHKSFSKQSIKQKSQKLVKKKSTKKRKPILTLSLCRTEVLVGCLTGRALCSLRNKVSDFF
jgi:hypothetical protein